ncbi:ComF family protein [Mesobaculum littorinae]|uniref:ComF family protein n=1 Tax=Mesobaculum littorinae TaxID=2486419 RepID=A0A438AHR3_9RHOB|nr:ComF family protein [Mesobaculum littorinae]RVV98246.1 ComF family protein [Mesobaculum littorinae]
MQSLLSLIYPHHCAICDTPVAAPGLCGPCWRDMPFLTGLVCDACGAALPGDEPDGRAVRCDACLAAPPPWEAGRAALSYAGSARRLVLALKHGDRLDLTGPAAGWMLAGAGPMIRAGQVMVPVPVHWTRRIARRYNQAALLSRAVARLAGGRSAPQALIRVARTPSQDGLNRARRFANLEGAIRPHPRLGAVLRGADVVLIDDVMTSGATLWAATRAAQAAGAARVSVLVLARVAPET